MIFGGCMSYRITF